MCIAIKTKGGLDYLTFDELYSKLKTLEVDIKGRSTYSPSSSATHSAFVGSASNKKIVPADGSTSSMTYITSAPKTHSESSNVMEDVICSFVAESEPQQQLWYDDLEQIDEFDMEEMDLKWQMAMLSMRVNRFQKKSGIRI